MAATKKEPIKPLRTLLNHKIRITAEAQMT